MPVSGSKRKVSFSTVRMGKERIKKARTDEGRYRSREAAARHLRKRRLQMPVCGESAAGS